MHRKWQVQRTNAEYVAYLSRAASVSQALAQVLINRGLKDPAAARAFLDSTAATLGDPFAIAGMAEAAAALSAAARNGTRVFVHGDYDADGITSTAIVVDALRRLGAETSFFIPNRFEDGYGFNVPAVDLARERGAGIILTVDCGISAFDAIERAASMGIEVIVTDHHEPAIGPDGATPVYPKARCIICPKITNPEASPLSGAGIALKLADALAREAPGRFDPHAYMDMAAIGTLADAVPLIGENRVIVREGLKLINSGARIGVTALKRAAGLDGKPLRAGRLAYTIVPRINAAGRLSDSTQVVELLLSGSVEEAERMADSLSAQNSERQRIEEEVYTQAVAAIEQHGPGAAIVLAREGWHEGVIGIVASRLVERFNRPAFVMSVKGEEAKGSGRSVPGFDIHRGLYECRDMLLTFGGHKQAAGLSLRVADLNAFERAISDIASRGIGGFAQPTLTIDAGISLGEVTFRLVDEVNQLEPFGTGNPEPVFGSRDVEIVSASTVGKNHLRMRVRSGNVTLDAIGFKMGEMLETVNDTATLDIAYAISINEWEGRRSLQLILKGIRPSM